MYEQPKVAVHAQRRASARAHNSNAHGPASTPGAGAVPHASPLTGHLAALVSATEAVRQAAESPEQRAELDAALAGLHARLAALAPAGAVPAQTTGGVIGRPGGSRLAMAHEHAHALAGRLLVVAAAQQDTVTAMLACRRMDAHAAARSAL
ncbi:hypothetical protein [Streptacidiphilus sp. P02-A3a]|uniref:hypothetical protein n=1 Tax=Streptacidiphilus sp. P02-A3a TaxID=2704468 RepID=UPI0015FC0A7F|nr:hypothetical protein [Streptacidiphilus sp. P02-A3a]QMU67660.1 hypothetical protein GXP74_04880 [Streptacidiphilus sp. P02-A3a]